MKIIRIITHYFIFFVFYSEIDLILSIRTKATQEPNTNLKALEELPQNKIGLMNQLPNGPVNENELPQDNDPFAVITFSNSVKNKKVGKMRINGKNVNLMFPTDNNYTYIQNLNEEEMIQHKIEHSRLENEKKTIIESQKNFENEFHKIYEDEKEFLNEKDKKDLMTLSIEKEQEIYNKEVKNELDEVRQRSFNGGIITPLLSYNLKNTKKFFRTN